MNNKLIGKKSKMKVGRPPFKGAFSLWVRPGDGLRMRSREKELRRFLSDVREGLIKDIGPTEDDLTTAQKVLIDRVLAKIAIIRLIEEHVREKGILRGDCFDPILAENYIAYSNSLRLTLRELGIKTRRADDAIDLTEYIRSKDAERSIRDAGEDLTAEKESGDKSEKSLGSDAKTGSGNQSNRPEIVRPGASSRDFPGCDKPEMENDN